LKRLVLGLLVMAMGAGYVGTAAAAPSAPAVNVVLSETAPCEFTAHVTWKVKGVQEVRAEWRLGGTSLEPQEAPTPLAGNAGMRGVDFRVSLPGTSTVGPQTLSVSGWLIGKNLTTVGTFESELTTTCERDFGSP
jgi:hypothetical protein